MLVSNWPPSAAPTSGSRDIRAQNSDHAKLEQLLAKTISLCSGNRVPDCPVLDILDIQRCLSAGVFGAM
jgi:hypothetical protein